VATPIGNLEDITLRALRVLRSASVIACEDTRHTQKLLNHFDIATRTISYHQHNEAGRAEELIARVENGEAVALVTDAGTPGISDPGERVIALAVARNLRVEVIPGPVAFVAALVASGISAESFRFIGFLPAKSGQRRTAIELFRNAQETVICYEAPHRLIECLADISELLGPARHIALARELTKIHEEVLRGSAANILEQLRSRGEVKGEVVLVISGAEKTSNPAPAQASDLHARLAAIMREQALDERAALKVLAKETGIKKSELYREVQRRKK